MLHLKIKFSQQDDITLYGFPIGSPEDKYFLMKSGGTKTLVDSHYWWSIFTRPIRSRFTRTQRVCVCMAILYMYFLADAIFYNRQPERTSNSLFTLGPLNFDPYDVRAYCI